MNSKCKLLAFVFVLSLSFVFSQEKQALMGCEGKGIICEECVQVKTIINIATEMALPWIERTREGEVQSAKYIHLIIAEMKKLIANDDLTLKNHPGCRIERIKWIRTAMAKIIPVYIKVHSSNWDANLKAIRCLESVFNYHFIKKDDQDANFKEVLAYDLPRKNYN